METPSSSPRCSRSSTARPLLASPIGGDIHRVEREFVRISKCSIEYPLSTTSPAPKAALISTFEWAWMSDLRRLTRQKATNEF